MVCASYLRFYKWSVLRALGNLSPTVEMSIKLTVCSMTSLDRAIKEENPPGVDSYQCRDVYDREDYSLYPYKSHWQPFRAWYGLVTCCLLFIFNGWRSIIPQWSAEDFIPSYLSVGYLFAFVEKKLSSSSHLYFSLSRYLSFLS